MQLRNCHLKQVTWFSYGKYPHRQQDHSQNRKPYEKMNKQEEEARGTANYPRDNGTIFKTIK